MNCRAGKLTKTGKTMAVDGESNDEFLYQRQAYKSLSAAVEGEVGVWMQRTKGKAKLAIVNPDIDGLLSYCILKAFDPTLRFGGYYLDEYQLLMTPYAAEVRRADLRGDPAGPFLSVENDLLVMDSIGQHFCILDDRRFARINPNALRFGTSDQRTLRRTLVRNFGSKYPFSTAFFLWAILLATPNSEINDEQLIALLYPDSAIVKNFGKKYERNVLSWFDWLGHSALGEQFYRLHRTPGIVQIAKCFYKAFKTTQPSVTFDGLPDRPRVNNKPMIQAALNYFCGLLGIDTQDVYDEELQIGRPYFYNRVITDRQDDYRDRQNLFCDWLEANIQDGCYVVSQNLDGTTPIRRHVVSEAVTTFGEWSVTTYHPWTPREGDHISFWDGKKKGVVTGRNKELQNHIRELKLYEPCETPSYGCAFPCGRSCEQYSSGS